MVKTLPGIYWMGLTNPLKGRYYFDNHCWLAMGKRPKCRRNDQCVDSKGVV